MPNWAVAKTKTGQEGTADDNLRRQGFETFLPRFRVTNVVRGSKTLAVRPLFPRYIFVRIAERWHSVFGTRGVVGMIMGGGDRPSVVPEPVMDELMARRDAAGFVVVGDEQATRGFMPGQAVRVSAGPMTGLSGVFDGAASAAERCHVLLSMFGRTSRAEIDVESLAPA